LDMQCVGNADRTVHLHAIAFSCGARTPYVRTLPRGLPPPHLRPTHRTHTACLYTPHPVACRAYRVPPCTAPCLTLTRPATPPHPAHTPTPLPPHCPFTAHPRIAHPTPPHTHHTPLPHPRLLCTTTKRLHPPQPYLTIVVCVATADGFPTCPAHLIRTPPHNEHVCLIATATAMYFCGLDGDLFANGTAAPVLAVPWHDMLNLVRWFCWRWLANAAY